MQDTLLSLLPSFIILGLVAVGALGITLKRSSPPENDVERRLAARWLAVGTGFQGLHFAEEAMTGFPERLGALLGLPPMPWAFFIVFNVAWLAIWMVSIPGLRLAHPVAFFAAWFLAIAAIVNCFAHPMLALAARGYFPGLISSPLIGAAGCILAYRLNGAIRQR